MPKKALTLELSISPRIAERYAAAAKRLQAKSTARAPTAAKLISLELMGRAPAVVSGEFSKKADHGKWFGAKAKNHQQKEYHDPPEAKR